MTEYFNSKQRADEPIEDFIERMEKDGRSLKLVGKVRLEAIRLGITRFQKPILETLIGESKITGDLILKVKERETLEKKFKRSEPYPTKEKEFGPNPVSNFVKKETTGKRIVCFACGKPGHIASDCRKGKSIQAVNEIVEEYEALNKEDFVYIGNNKIFPLFDTGAKGNYITKPFCKKFNIRIAELKTPLQRFTCLGQPFLIKEQAKVDFSYKGTQWKETFSVLPKRNDVEMLLGKNWIRETTNQKLDKKEPNMKVSKDEEVADFKGEELIREFFKGRREGIRGDYECPIDTKEGDRVVQSASLIPQTIERRVDLEVKRLLEIGFIKESRSTWCNKIRPVEKANGDIRLTTNLILLNQKVALDCYSLPNMEQMLYSLKDQKYFTKLDLKDGFFQIPLRKEDTHKTAFRVKNKLYEWLRMPMGFKNSPAIFQRFMDSVLRDEIGRNCQVYVDDILIFGKTEKEHDLAVERILNTLVRVGLKGSEDKCEFKKTKIEFLGHKIEENKIMPVIKEEVLQNTYKIPENIDQVRRFLGIITFYRKFIPSCSTLCSPLYELLKKDAKFVWGKQENEAFERLKSSLMNPKALAQPDFKRGFILDTDASKTGVGAILSQVTNGEERPIAYASRSTSSAERNYSISEKEMLAGIWAMEHFEYYLYGREFIWRSDHKALEAFNTKGYLDSERIQRWMERIQKFSFKVEYVKGDEMTHVDALSRMFENEDKSINEIRDKEIDVDEKKLIIKAHEELLHRGAKATLYTLKEKYGAVYKESIVRNVLNGCLICKKYNFCKGKGFRHITAYEVGEKVGFDIIGPFEGHYIITAIDYFSRQGFALAVRSRGTEKILRLLKKVNEIIKVKMFISDGAKENLSIMIRKWMETEGIKHHVTSPHHPESNGRIERFNQSILQSLFKMEGKGKLNCRLNKAIHAYNHSFHEGLGMTPNEMLDEENWTEEKRRQFEKVLSRFEGRREGSKWTKLNIGDKVLIKDEIHKVKGQPIFRETGEIVAVQEFDTYSVKKSSGHTFKRHASQLRTIKEGNPEETECQIKFK